MFIKFSEEAQKVLKRAKQEMVKLHHAFIGSEHVLLSILNGNNAISNKLHEYRVDYISFKEELIKCIGIGSSNNNYLIYTPLLKRVLENAFLDARENNKEVSIEMIFLSILDEGEGVAIRILNNLGINIDDLYMELNKKVIKKSNKKLLINDYGIDLNKKALDGKIEPLIGRDKEINEIIEILLRKNKNNPLLIGEAGVGKTAIVEALAKRIIDEKVPDKLKNTKIYSISMANLVAGTKYRGEFEEKINKMLRELENNKNIIVFIDEIHTLVGAGGAEGAIDASNIIKPALARGEIKLIGATTINEYKETIRKDKALNRRFQTINVNENSLSETKNILLQLKSVYEEFHHVVIPDSIIDKIVYFADKYISDKCNPDKSIDILDTVCTKVSLMQNNTIIKLDKLKEQLKEIKRRKNQLIVNQEFNEAYHLKNDEMKLESEINHLNIVISNKNKKTVTIDDLSDVIESKSKIPIYELKKDSSKLKGLSKYIKSKVIGQDNVIDQVNKVLWKIVLGYKNNLPTSFLFIGKSGVGKTMLVKEYSKYLNIPLIRLDMSEYKEAHTISKIIGSPPGYIGYDDVDNVLEKVKNNPFSMILLDEIEKASSEVINLFLQVLDEGMMTDSHGNKVSFKNTIIIMTSNIGSDKENIGFNNNSNLHTELNNILSTSFVNRINNIFRFNNLDLTSIKKIVNKELKIIKSKYKDHNINIRISNKFINNIIDNSEYIKYGARKVCRLIEDEIDNLVIDKIIKGKNNIYITRH